MGVFPLHTEGRETGNPLEHLLQVWGPCSQQDICALTAGNSGYQIWLIDPACSSIWGLSSEATSFEDDFLSTGSSSTRLSGCPVLRAGPRGYCVLPEPMGSIVRGTVSLLSWHPQSVWSGGAGTAHRPQHLGKGLLQRAEVAERRLRACRANGCSCGSKETGRDHLLGHLLGSLTWEGHIPATEGPGAQIPPLCRQGTDV